MIRVARQDAKGNLLEGKRIMDSILQAHPDIKGVICGNGPVALGAVAALKPLAGRMSPWWASTAATMNVTPF